MTGWLRVFRVARPGGPTLANLWESLAHFRGGVWLRFQPRPGFIGLERGEAEARGLSVMVARLAEALVRKWDLKKGERAVVAARHPLEFLVLSTALARAGGITVPFVESWFSRAGEVVRAAGATLALVVPSLLEEREDLREGLSPVERRIVVGRDGAGGWESLFREAEGSSGFFLPYTLKPGNVVLLLPRPEGDGMPRMVMVTNSSLFFPLRLLPVARYWSARGGGVTLLSFNPGETSGWAAAMLGLFAGRQAMVGRGASGWVAASGGGLLVTDASTTAGLFRGHGGVPRVAGWINLGSEIVPGAGKGGPAARAIPALARRFIHLYDLEGCCSAFTAWAGDPRTPGAWDKTGLLIPGNRVRLSGNGSGEVLLRGPSVFPGYWNDLEETLRRWEGGWLHTGVEATRRGPWMRVVD